MALTTDKACATGLNIQFSVLLRWINLLRLISTATHNTIDTRNIDTGINGGEKSHRKTRETTAWSRGV